MNRFLRTILSLSLLLGSSALGVGCFRHTEVVTTMPNPLVAGGITPNEIPQLYTSTERNHQIPDGSLTDSATLTTLDGGQACFHVVLRALEDGSGQSWTDLSSWRISLLTEDVEMVQPTVEIQQPTQAQYQGRQQQEVVVGQRSVCVDGNGRERPQNDVTPERPCTRWETRPITQTQWVPAVLTVTTGGGNVCFQNQGHITPTTTQITLKMQRTMRRLDFTWAFQ